MMKTNQPTYNELTKRVFELENELKRQKETEIRLRQSVREYRILTEAQKDVVIRLSPSGRIEYCSPVIQKFGGYDPAGDIGRDMSEYFADPREFEQGINLLTEIVDHKTPATFEFLFQPLDKPPFYVELSGTPILKNGRVEAIHCIMRDISIRKDMEKKLKTTNETLNKVLSASPVGIGFFQDGKIQWSNPAMRRIFGYDSADSFDNKDPAILFPSREEAERVFKVVENKLSTNKPVKMDVIFKRKNNEFFPGHLMMSCLDEDDPMEKIIFTISDISWRKHAEQDRMKREKLQGVLELSGAVCHELNQPLQVIAYLSDMMVVEEDNPLFKEINIIKEQIQKMGNLTRKLMRITRYETCEYPGGIRIIDLNKAAEGGGLEKESIKAMTGKPSNHKTVSKYG